MIVPEIDPQKVEYHRSLISINNPSSTLDYCLNRPNGEQRWIRWTAHGIFNETCEIKEFLCAGRDITDLKNTQDALVRLKEEAENANKAKSDFLARMSHELRTPLNSVIGFASILCKNKEGNLSGKDINFINRVFNNGKHLLDLINQILDLSKIESGRMDIQESVVYLNQLVWEIFDQMEEQVRLKRIELCADIPEHIAPIKTDEGKMRQILFNLIGNAVKFTERGSVMVRIAADPVSRLPVRLDVIDTGIGISESRLSTIFEPFQQAETSTSRHYGGTGLGLTISKSLCELLGFQIEVQSKLGKGTQFQIHIHATPVEEEIFEGNKPAKAQEIIPTLSDLKGITALIIDPDQDSRILLQDTLEEFGCKTLHTASGEEGLDLAIQNKPDIILMDVLMPGMNGWEVLINLKSNPELNMIPVIIVSVVASDLRGVSLGLVDLLDKPFHPKELHDLIYRNVYSSKCRVLVLEKPEQDQPEISSYLQNSSFHLCVVNNPEDALNQLHSDLLDIVIVDIPESGLDQLDFIASLRKDSNLQHVPIVVTTSRSITVDEIPYLNSHDRVVQRGNGIQQELKDTLEELVTV